MFHYVYGLILLVFLAISSMLIGISTIDYSDNVGMFWTGVSFFILTSLMIINWPILACGENGWTCSGGPYIQEEKAMHMIFMNLCIILLMIATITLTQGLFKNSSTLFWVGIGFFCASGVDIIVWISTSCYITFG